MRHSPQSQVRLFLIALVVCAGISPTARASSCLQGLQAILADVAPESELTRYHELAVAILPPNATTLKQLKTPLDKGGLKSVHYLVDMNDKLYFSAPGQAIDFTTFNKNDIPLATLTDAAGVQVTVPLKEAGDLSFQPSTLTQWKKVLFGNKTNSDKFVFEKQIGFDLSDEESAKIFNQAQEEFGKVSGIEEEMARVAAADKGFEQARVYRCTEVFQAHTRTDKFLFDKLAADMTIMTTNIAIMNPQRFDGALVYWGLKDSEPGKDYNEDMLAADYLSTPVNTIMKTTVGLMLVKSGAGMSKSFSTRIGVSLGSTALQTVLYSAMTDNNSKGIGAFNMGYMVYSVVKSHFLDQWVYNALPGIAYNACLNNSALRFIVSPTTIRFGEGFASSVIYYKARKAIIGE